MTPEESTIPVYRQAMLMLGVVIILIVGFVSNLEFLQRARGMITGDGPYLDGITAWENHLTLLTDDLPKSGEIGYISDWDIPGHEGSSDLETEFRLTQYALAPIVVARGADFDYVVGNITITAFDEELQEYFRLQVQHDFGYGILLLRKY